MNNVLHSSIKEIQTLPTTTPEILEQIAHKVLMNSDLDKETLYDDQDGAPGGFCQLLSSKLLRQYLEDSINNGVYGAFNNAKDLCKSSRKTGLLQAVKAYNDTLKYPHALWHLEDNDWPDTARLAKPQDVIGCLKNIIQDASYSTNN